MKITAGKRGDAAREAKDKAENKYYWDKYQRSKVLPTITKEFDARDEQTVNDIRRQIDRLISDGYAKQIFEDDVYVKIQGDSGNRTFAIRDEALGNSRASRRREYPGQIYVTVGNKYYGGDHPFEWEWRAKFDYSYKDDKFTLKNDISSYSFNSADPEDIEYFAASGQIFKALSKLNWNKILTTDPYEGLGDLYKQLPDEPNRYDIEDGGKLDRDIKEADIQDALEEWKKGKKWIYVANRLGYRWDWTHDSGRKIDTPAGDGVSSDLLNGAGYYRYLGETGKYYRVEFMPAREGQRKIKEGEEPEAYKWANRDKVRKDEFERCIYYPITWFGRA